MVFSELLETLKNIKIVYGMLIPAEKDELLKYIKSAHKILCDLCVDPEISVQQLGFNDYHLKLFRVLVTAAGAAVTKQTICDNVWNDPGLRYTDNVFHNTLYKVKQVLKGYNIYIVSWGQKQWKIETSSLPLAEKLLSQVDYNIRTSSIVKIYAEAIKKTATRPQVETEFEKPRIVPVDDSFVEDPNQPPSTPF